MEQGAHKAIIANGQTVMGHPCLKFITDILEMN
jgi:hypothetical protein